MNNTVTNEQLQRIQTMRNYWKGIGVAIDEINNKQIYAIATKERAECHIVSQEQKNKIRERLLDTGKADKLMIEINDNNRDSIREVMNIEIIDCFEHIMVYQTLLNADFRAFFGIKWDKDEEHRCLFLTGNKAWVHQDPYTNKFRYFSKYKNAEITAFNIYDLIEIIYGFDTITARKLIIRSLDYKYYEGSWEEMQELKYIQNNTVLQNTLLWEKKYPYLYKYTKSYLPILEKLNSFGMANITESRNSVDGQSLFYASGEFLKHYGKEASTITKINDSVNMFAVLGMLNKVKDERDIPSDMLEKASSLCGKNAFHNIMNFYTLAVLDDMILQRANERARLLLENKVSVDAITKEKVAKLFGFATANSIYGSKRLRREVVNIYNNKDDDRDEPIIVVPFASREREEDDSDELPF